MNKYQINCSNCGLKISMLLASRPSKCPRCKEYFGFHDLTGGEHHSSGIRISDSFTSGGSKYIHAEGDCFVETENDVVMDVDTVVTAIKGAKVEMTNPTVDKKPSFPETLDYCGIEISPPKVFILQRIISDVIGVADTLSMTAVELKTFFRVVQNRIYNGLVSGLNGGALTGIRVLHSSGYNMLEIIDSNGILTDEGVKLLKYIAQKMV
jgi:hypothetical protein